MLSHWPCWTERKITSLGKSSRISKNFQGILILKDSNPPSLFCSDLLRFDQICLNFTKFLFQGEFYRHTFGTWKLYTWVFWFRNVKDIIWPHDRFDPMAEENIATVNIVIFNLVIMQIFLDVLVIRLLNGRLDNSVYFILKPLTVTYANFYQHPAQKLSVVNTLAIESLPFLNRNKFKFNWIIFSKPFRTLLIKNALSRP